MAESNEANATQLALARREGAAYDALVRWEAAGAGWAQAANAGDYRFVASLTPAEGWWSDASGTPRWTDAPAGTVHLRVFPEDAASLRFVPELTMRARMLDANESILTEAPLVSALYPVTEAYGANVTLPPGTTRIAVVVEPLQAMRHDPYNGDRFFRRTTVLFNAPTGTPTTGPTASERAERAPPAALMIERKAALDATLQNMWSQASDGSQKPAENMTIAYAIEYSEGFWQFADDSEYGYSIENDASERTNAHVEVAPIDPRTRSFLPGATISTVISRPGTD